MNSFLGPVSLVTGKNRRLTLIEVPNEVNAMIDAAKVADLTLLLIDAGFGFEMEHFEFINICKVHGMPMFMGVLTHMDLVNTAAKLKEQKNVIKHRFWKETYQGAKLFLLTKVLHDSYLHNEIQNLARFVSVIKFRPLQWRDAHPFVLCDRIEDITDPLVCYKILHTKCKFLDDSRESRSRSKCLPVWLGSWKLFAQSIYRSHSRCW